MNKKRYIPTKEQTIKYKANQLRKNPNYLKEYQKTEGYKNSKRKWAKSTKGIISIILGRIKGRQKDTDIDKEWVASRIDKGICELTGIPFIFTRINPSDARGYFSPSIDRIDNSKGYFKDNCRLILCWLNLAKQEMPEDLFISSLLKVAEVLNEKNKLSS